MAGLLPIYSNEMDNSLETFSDGIISTICPLCGPGALAVIVHSIAFSHPLWWIFSLLLQFVHLKRLSTVLIVALSKRNARKTPLPFRFFQTQKTHSSPATGEWLFAKRQQKSALPGAAKQKKELTLDARVVSHGAKGQFSEFLVSNINLTSLSTGWTPDSWWSLRYLPVHWYHPFWL